MNKDYSKFIESRNKSSVDQWRGSNQEEIPNETTRQLGLIFDDTANQNQFLNIHDVQAK